jgi:hypothetical protein
MEEDKREEEEHLLRFDISSMRRRCPNCSRVLTIYVNQCSQLKYLQVRISQTNNTFLGRRTGKATLRRNYEERCIDKIFNFETRNKIFLCLTSAKQNPNT